MKRPEQKAAIEAAARDLPPHLYSAFRALAFDLDSHRNRWGLFLLKFEHGKTQTQVANAIRRFLQKVAVVDAKKYASWSDLEEILAKTDKSNDAIELPNLDEWLDESTDAALANSRLRAWNIRREGYASTVTIPLLCWLRADRLRALANTAPDLWSWRTGVYEFVEEEEPDIAPVLPSLPAKMADIDNRTAAERRQRLHAITQYLTSHGKKINTSVMASLLGELADIQKSLGEYKQTLQTLEQLTRLYETDEMLGAHAHNKIADILFLQGQWDNALAIYQATVLTYEKLNDAHALALTWGSIADILYLRGDRGEALCIRSEKEIPSHEKNGDVRSQIIVIGKIATALGTLGNNDSSLTSIRPEVRPTIENLEDLPARANIVTDINNILHKQGKIDEVLHNFREEKITVFEKANTLHNLSVTQTRMPAVFIIPHNTDKAHLRQALSYAVAVANRLNLTYDAATIEKWIADSLSNHTPDLKPI